MIQQGYQDKKTIQRRIDKMKDWINNPELLEADEGANYKKLLKLI